MIESTADRFIEVMAKIKDLDSLISTDQPMRHEIRELKQAANQILDDAINNARRVASAAKYVHETAHKEINQRLSTENQ